MAGMEHPKQEIVLLRVAICLGLGLISICLCQDFFALCVSLFRDVLLLSREEDEGRRRRFGGKHKFYLIVIITIQHEVAGWSSMGFRSKK